MQKDVGEAIIIITILMGSMLGNGGVLRRTPRDLINTFFFKMGLGACSKDAKAHWRNYLFIYYCLKLMYTHVYILGAPIQLIGCFEVYPNTC
jgi:hypothetical protein